MLAGVAGIWLALDRRPPEWDHANHLERVVNCAHDMARADITTIIERSSFYPPLAVCTAGLAYSLAPSDVASAQAVILLFLGLAMASIYMLARSYTGLSGAVVAALLFGSASFVVYSSLRFQLDLPLAAMVAVTLVLLRRVDGFSRLGWSVLLGVVLGLGMLTKPPFAVYVLPPLLVVGARARGLRSLGNLVLAALTGGAVAVLWYGSRLMGLYGQIEARSLGQAAKSGHAPPGQRKVFLFYPKHFWSASRSGSATSSGSSRATSGARASSSALVGARVSPRALHARRGDGDHGRLRGPGVWRRSIRRRQRSLQGRPGSG